MMWKELITKIQKKIDETDVLTLITKDAKRYQAHGNIDPVDISEYAKKVFSFAGLPTLSVVFVLVLVVILGIVSYHTQNKSYLLGIKDFSLFMLVLEFISILIGQRWKDLASVSFWLETIVIIIASYTVYYVVKKVTRFICNKNSINHFIPYLLHYVILGISLCYICLMFLWVILQY